MKYFTRLLLLLFPAQLFAQNDSAAAKEKIGHRFYLKTEVLNTLLRAAFAPKTYFLDVQAGFRLSDHFHLVSTYGKTTFYISESAESITQPGLFQEIVREGAALHRSECMLRYYPFNNFENWPDYLFAEGGMHFHHYKGTTNGRIFDSTAMSVQSQYVHTLDMYRYGPQLNVGMSYYFQRETDEDGRRPKVIFSPEVFAGVLYNQLHITKNEITDIAGTTPNEPYTEPKFKMVIRVKLGIGFL